MFPGTKVAGVNTIDMDGRTNEFAEPMTFGKTAKTKESNRSADRRISRDRNLPGTVRN